MAYQAPSLSEYVNLGQAMRSGMDRREELARRDQQEKRNQELHDARMEEIKASRQRRIALEDAAAPRTAQEGAVVDGGQGREFYSDPSKVTPELQQDRQIEAEMRAEQAGQPAPSLAQARPGYGVTAGNQGQIRTERPNLAAENSPDARLNRQINVIQRSDPEKAISLSNLAIDHSKKQRAESDVNFERSIYGAQDPQGLTDFMSKTLTEQMGTDVKAEYVQSPDGKSWVLGVNVGGQRKPIGQFTNDADGFQKAKEAVFQRMASPEAQRNLESQKAKIEALKSNTEYKNALAEAAGRNADSNAKRANRTTASENSLSREERIRYTNLFSDAGRRLGEANKALNTLQRDYMFMKKAAVPGSPQEQQLKDLQTSIKGYSEERTLYQGMLAKSQSGAAPSLSSARPGSTARLQPMPAQKSALKAGVIYDTPRGPAKWNGTEFEAQ